MEGLPSNLTCMYHASCRLLECLSCAAEAFKRDSSDDRLNLGVGAYRTNDLKPYVLNVVKKVCVVHRPCSINSFIACLARLLRGAYHQGQQAAVSCVPDLSIHPRALTGRFTLRS